MDEAYRMKKVSHLLVAARLHHILSRGADPSDAAKQAASRLGTRFPRAERQRWVAGEHEGSESQAVLAELEGMSPEVAGHHIARRSTEPLPGGQITRSQPLAADTLSAGITVWTPQLQYEATTLTTPAPYYFRKSRAAVEPADKDAVTPAKIAATVTARLAKRAPKSVPHSFRGLGRTTRDSIDTGHQGRISLLVKARASAKRKRKKGTAASSTSTKIITGSRQAAVTHPPSPTSGGVVVTDAAAAEEMFSGSDSDPYGY